MIDKLEKEQLLRAAEVERLYGLDRKALATWRRRRMGPRFYRVHGKILYDVRDLLDFLKEWCDEKQ